MKSGILWQESPLTPEVVCPGCGEKVKPHGYLLEGFLGRSKIATISWDANKKEYRGQFFPTKGSQIGPNLTKHKKDMDSALRAWVSIAGLSFDTPEEAETPQEASANDDKTDETEG